MSNEADVALRLAHTTSEATGDRLLSDDAQDGHNLACTSSQIDSGTSRGLESISIIQHTKTVYSTWDDEPIVTFRLIVDGCDLGLSVAPQSVFQLLQIVLELGGRRANVDITHN